MSGTLEGREGERRRQMTADRRRMRRFTLCEEGRLSGWRRMNERWVEEEGNKYTIHGGRSYLQGGGKDKKKTMNKTVESEQGMTEASSSEANEEAKEDDEIG